MPQSPIIIEPTNEHLFSALWLHGLGASAEDFYTLLPALSFAKKPSFRWIFPNAPMREVTINGGMVMPSWFDITSFSPHFSANEKDVAQSSNNIQALLQGEKARLLGVESCIYLIGFSQGGLIALHTGILSVACGLVDQLSIMGLSCAHPFLEKLVGGLSSCQLDRVRAGVRVCLMHGEEDEVIPVDLGKESVAVLKRFAIPVLWKSYAMGHQVSPLQIKDITDILNA